MFGIDVRSIPGCSSYQSAAEIWDTAADCSHMAVWGANARPLDGVRKRHKAITKHADGSFSFDLYQTEMVRYYPNGTIGGTVDERRSSVQFFHRVTPYGLWITSWYDHGYLVIDTKGVAREYIVPEGRTFKVEPDGPRHWRLVTPHTQRTRMVPDRKKIYAISKAFKPFYGWVAAAERVTGRSVIGFSGRRPELHGITMPPSVDQYGHLAACGTSLDDLKLRLNEHFGAYTRVNIPNTERPRRSTLGHYQDT